MTRVRWAEGGFSALFTAHDCRRRPLRADDDAQSAKMLRPRSPLATGARHGARIPPKAVGPEVWAHLKSISPAHHLLAILSTLVAYVALAWYDRIGLLHLG